MLWSRVRPLFDVSPDRHYVMVLQELQRKLALGQNDIRGRFQECIHTVLQFCSRQIPELAKDLKALVDSHLSKKGSWTPRSTVDQNLDRLDAEMSRSLQAHLTTIDADARESHTRRSPPLPPHRTTPPAPPPLASESPSQRHMGFGGGGGWDEGAEGALADAVGAIESIRSQIADLQREAAADAAAAAAGAASDATARRSGGDRGDGGSGGGDGGWVVRLVKVEGHGASESSEAPSLPHQWLRPGSGDYGGDGGGGGSGGGGYIAEVAAAEATATPATAMDPAVRVSGSWGRGGSDGRRGSSAASWVSFAADLAGPTAAEDGLEDGAQELVGGGRPREGVVEAARNAARNRLRKCPQASRQLDPVGMFKRDVAKSTQTHILHAHASKVMRFHQLAQQQRSAALLSKPHVTAIVSTAAEGYKAVAVQHEGKNTVGVTSKRMQSQAEAQHESPRRPRMITARGYIQPCTAPTPEMLDAFAAGQVRGVMGYD